MIEDSLENVANMFVKSAPDAVEDFAIDGTREREEDFSTSDSSQEQDIDVVDENDFESSSEEEPENSSSEKNVESVFRFNLESTMEWKVGDRIFPFETTSCKERSEIDFDNLISGTATRDGLWTSEGNFVSADASKRCPLDGRCEGMLLFFMKSNLYENKPTNSQNTNRKRSGALLCGDAGLRLRTVCEHIRVRAVDFHRSDE